MGFKLFEYTEMLAFLTSIFCIKWIWNTPYRLFIFYLFATVMIEQAGAYLGKANLKEYNQLMYSVFTVAEFGFFFYLFYFNYQKQHFKNILLILVVIFLLFAACNLFFIQGLWTYNAYSLLLGSIILIIAVYLFFYDVFERNEPLNFLNKPMFWIAIGTFIFYLGDFIFNLMSPYMHANQLEKERNLFTLINNNLIVFEFLSFSIALIICTRNRLTSKSQL